MMLARRALGVVLGVTLALGGALVAPVAAQAAAPPTGLGSIHGTVTTFGPLNETGLVASLTPGPGIAEAAGEFADQPVHNGEFTFVGLVPGAYILLVHGGIYGNTLLTPLIEDASVKEVAVPVALPVTGPVPTPPVTPVSPPVGPPPTAPGPIVFITGSVDIRIEASEGSLVATGLLAQLSVYDPASQHYVDQGAPIGTASDGFVFLGLTPGSYRVHIAGGVYQPVDVDVVVLAGVTTQKRARLDLVISATPPATDIPSAQPAAVTTSPSAAVVTAAPVSAAATAPAPAVLVAATPALAGTAKVGKTIKAATGTWAKGTKLSYRWYANGKLIKKATKSALKLTASVKGKKITVKVTGRKKGFSTVVKTSKASAKVK